MNINQYFNNLATTAAEKGTDGSQIAAQRDRLFNEKIAPTLKSRNASDVDIAKAKSQWVAKTDKVMQSNGLIPKAGQSHTSFAKDKRAEAAIRESAKTGSNWPIIKETARTTLDVIGNKFGQGTGGMIEGAAGFVRDIGENETDSFAAKAANYGRDLRKGYEDSSSTYQKEVEAGDHGKTAQLATGAVQSAPAMAMPFGVAKVGTKAAAAIPMLASHAPKVGLVAGVAAGHTQNYGEVRRNATANLERDFPTWEKLSGNPVFEQIVQRNIDSGLSIAQARKDAHAKTLDMLSEQAADTYGSAMTAMDFIAPSGAVLGSGILKNAPSSKVGQALVGGGVAKELVKRELKQTVPRTGLAKLVPDVSLAGNKEAAKMVGKQAIEEGIQGGIGEYGAQNASAAIGGTPVDWKGVGTAVAEEALLGGIMGGGMQSASRGTPNHQAANVANQLRNQTNRVRAEHKSATQELQQAQAAGDQEGIIQAQNQLNNVQLEAAAIGEQYAKYEVDAPYFIQSMVKSQQQAAAQPAAQAPQPAAPVQPVVQPQPAQPAAPTKTPINKKQANTTNLVMKAVVGGVLSTDEANAIQSDPLRGQIFTLSVNGDNAKAHGLVMESLNNGAIDFDMAQNLIGSIDTYHNLGRAEKPTLSGIVNSHVASQIQATEDPYQGIVDVDPETFEPVNKVFYNRAKGNEYLRNGQLDADYELFENGDGGFEIRKKQGAVSDDGPGLTDFTDPVSPVEGQSDIDYESDAEFDALLEAVPPAQSQIPDESVPDIIEPIPEPEPIAPVEEPAPTQQTFADIVKASSFIREKGISQTHKAVKQPNGRFAIMENGQDQALEPQAGPIVDPVTPAPVEPLIEAPEAKAEPMPQAETPEPAAELTFSEKIADAHVNNPRAKAALINAEIAKGRNRADVFKEVAQVVEQLKGKSVEPKIDAAPEQPLQAKQDVIFSGESGVNPSAAKTEVDPAIEEIAAKNPVQAEVNENLPAVSENLPLNNENPLPESDKTAEDIGRKSDGKPFANESAAKKRMKDEGLAETHEVVKLGPSQFVVRKKQEETKQEEDKPASEPDPFNKSANDVAQLYGRAVDKNNQILGKGGKETGVFIKEKKGRFTVSAQVNGKDKTLSTGSTSELEKHLGSFFEKYWYDKRVKQPAANEQPAVSRESFEKAANYTFDQFGLEPSNRKDAWSSYDAIYNSTVLRLSEPKDGKINVNLNYGQGNIVIDKEFSVNDLGPALATTISEWSRAALEIEQNKRAETAKKDKAEAPAPEQKPTQEDQPQSDKTGTEELQKLMRAAEDMNKPKEDQGITFPSDKVAQAFAGVHRTSSNTAKSMKDSYEKFVEEAKEQAQAFVKTEAQQKALDDAMLKLQQDYINTHLPALLNVASGAVSSFVAGRNNFNSKQANKRNDALTEALDKFDKKLDILKYQPKFEVLSARTPEQVKADQEEAKAKSDAVRAEREKKELDLAAAKSEAKPKRKTASNANVPDPDTAKHMTMAQWQKLGKDYKSVVDGIRYTTSLVNGATSLVPVWITDEKGSSKKQDAPAADPAPAETDNSNYRENAKAITKRLNDADETLTLDEVKSGLNALAANMENIVADYNKLTKAKLLDFFHPFYAARYKNEKKDYLVKKLSEDELMRFYFLNDGVMSYSWGDKRTFAERIVQDVQEATEADFKAYIEQRKRQIAKNKEDQKAYEEGLKDPQTILDFTHVFEQSEFTKVSDWYKSLPLAQQVRYDTLKADAFNESRMQQMEAKRANEAYSKASTAVSSNTEATLFAGKHTKKGYDIWTVQLNGRVESDQFSEYRDQAKAAGGYYSSFKGNGAIPGFIFDNEAAANEFMAEVTGSQDTETEVDAALPVDPQAEIEIVETDAQKHAEKLREKAQTIIGRGDQKLKQDRKVNTHKRAGEARRAEEQANREIFIGETLNRIADGIENGSLKYLNRVTAKTQVELLERLLHQGSYDQQTETKAKEREINNTTIAYTEFPKYQFRIDMLDYVIKSLSDVKPSMAQEIQRAIDRKRASEYLSWLAKDADEFGNKNYENMLAVTTDGKPAVFNTNINDAERLLKRLTKGQEVPKFQLYKIANGKYGVITSRQEATSSNRWTPQINNITFTTEYGHQIYDVMKKRSKSDPKYSMNWLVDLKRDNVSKMEALDIHDEHSFRNMMREYLSVRSKEKAADPIKEMERSMIGRSNDGMDFFPTPRIIVEQMIELADINPEHKVLEPSAGMGHIADILKDYGVNPDVVELSPKRKELLKMKGYSVVGTDFLEFDKSNRSPGYGDTFKTADGKYQGIMRGAGGLGSSRVRLVKEDTGETITYFDRDELELVKMNGDKYDRIIMNPPFSDRRDSAHIYHAFDMLADDGVMVAIAGEGVFSGSDAKAKEFQSWLDAVNADVTELEAGAFNDPNLPVTTNAKARIITIHKADSKGKLFSRKLELNDNPDQIQKTGSTVAQVRQDLVSRFGEDVIQKLENDGKLEIIEQSEIEGAEGWYQDGKATLVAGNLTAETIIPTFLHEVGGHAGMQQLLKPSAYESLMTDFNRLVESGNAEALEAKRLAERETDAKTQQAEYLPYLVTVAAKNQAQQGAAQRFVKRLISAVKAWAVDKLGVSLKLTPSDILALSERMIDRVAENPTPTPPKGKKPQIETTAFKKWFGSSKVVDVNGKPKIVYHGTNQLFNIFNVSDIGIHAGTLDQANSRKSEKSTGEFKVMQLYMRIDNPLRLKDSPSWKDPAFYIQKTGISQYLSKPLVQRIQNFYSNLEGINLKTEQGQKQALEMAMSINKLVTQELKAQGYDGIVYKNTHDGTSLENKMKEEDSYIVFDPEQIKSATDNVGTFNPNNPDIRYSRLFSRSGNPQTWSKARQRQALNSVAQSTFGEMALKGIEATKTVSGRTVELFQTMLHKAITDESGQFKRTFDLVQDKINHVTFVSAKSMDAAPSVLTQLEQGSDYVKEIKRVGRIAGHALSKGKINKAKIDTDIEKVGQLMFENTLMDQPQRHTEKELRQLGFDNDQIKVYGEIRDAIDTSLDTFANTTFSNIYKHLGGTDQEVLDLAARNLDIYDHYNEIIKMIDTLTKGDPDKADARQTAIESVDKVFKKANDLKDEGYVPLMRFGKYFVRIFDPNTGEVAYRQHFESESERNIFFKKYDQSKLPSGYVLEKGQINELQHKLFQGVSPETVALFAKESGLPQGDTSEAYIKYAVQNNHALKRLLKRQGIDGFDTDVKRVLASFVLSNSRYSANQLYNPAVDESITQIEDPKRQEDAIRLRDYSLDTQEELSGLKNFAFVYYMGFSVMFGLVNLTQPLLQTMPYLMQYTKDHGVTGKAFLKAVNTWHNGSDVMDAKYKPFYERARKEGHLDPQNTWMMQGLERGRSGLGASTWQLISHSSGLFAQASETVNRRTTLFAALDVAEGLGQQKLEKLGFKDAYDFAVHTIQETQGIYNKGNRPRVSRGNIGSVLMMYKQFMIAYIEQMVRMQKSGLYGGEDDEFKKAMAKLVGFGVSRSVLMALGILYAFSGATGLPFVRDILDGVETAGGLVGKPLNTEREVQVALHNALGSTLGNTVNTVLMDGIVNLNPWVDVKGRMGMGDLIPATAYFSPTTSEYMRGNEASQVFGAMGGLVEKVTEATKLAQVGAYGQAGVQLMPKAWTSFAQGGMAAATGDYRNMKTGVKTNDATVVDGLVKFLDAQPATIAKEGRVRGLEMKDRSVQQSVNSLWRERYTEALESGDREQLRAVKAQIADHNAENPRYPITFNQKRAETNYNKSNQSWQEKRKDSKGLEWMDNYNTYL